MTSLRLVLSIVALVLGLRASCYADDVYLGIAEPGAGEAMAGHAFLSVAHKNLSPLLGMVYSYGAKPEGLSMRLAANRVPGMLYYKQMAIQENRSLYYFKLKVSDAEALELARLVESDYQTTQTQQESYDVLSNNCLTHVLSLINKIVPPSRQIQNLNGDASWLTQPVENFKETMRLKIPYLTPLALEKHALVDGKPHWIPKFDVEQKRLFNEVTIPAIQKLSACEQWQSQTSNLIALSVAMSLKQQDTELLQPIHRLIKNRNQLCREETLGFWDAVYNLIPYYQSAQLQIINDWMSEVSQ